MEEKYNIPCLIDDVETEANLQLDEDNCRILFELGNYSIAIEAENYFYALLELRRKLEPLNVKVLCKGACRYVYPSPMILSMGDAIKAYRLTLGKQASLSDLVNIFEPCEPNEYASIDEQLAYYQEWKRSRQSI